MWLGMKSYAVVVVVVKGSAPLARIDTTKRRIDWSLTTLSVQDAKDAWSFALKMPYM